VEVGEKPHDRQLEHEKCEERGQIDEGLVNKGHEMWQGEGRCRDDDKEMWGKDLQQSCLEVSTS